MFDSMEDRFYTYTLIIYTFNKTFVLFAFHYEHLREYLTYSGGENRGRGILKPKESSQQNTAEAYNIPLDVPNLIRKGEILLFFP